MKTKPFLLIALFLFLGFPQSRATNSPMILAKEKDLNVAFNNMCEDYGQIIICNGIDSLGIHPDLGSGNCPSYLHYTHYDSLLNFQNAKYLDVVDDMSGPWSVKQMYVGDEHKIVSYYITYGNYYCDTLFIERNDTLESDSINGIGLLNNYNLGLIRNSSVTSNFLVYDSTMALVVSMQLPFTPHFLSYMYQYKVAVFGIDQNGETVLNIIDMSTQSIIKDTLLGPFAANPISIAFGSSHIIIAAQPGDSMVTIVKYNTITDVITSAIAYQGSGTKAFTWAGISFHFQPDQDTSGTLDNQVLEFNCNTMTVINTFNIQKRLRVLSYPVTPGSISNYPYINVVDTGVSDIVYVYWIGTYTQVDFFLTHAQPSLFATDYRCAAKISEYDDSKVEWKVYPNPSMDDFKLSASGLICGRDYKMDIVDGNGKVLYESTVHAKMTITLPTSHFEPGIYYVRIHTLKGFITQEIIKQ